MSLMLPAPVPLPAPTGSACSQRVQLGRFPHETIAPLVAFVQVTETERLEPIVRHGGNDRRARSGRWCDGFRFHHDEGSSMSTAPDRSSAALLVPRDHAGVLAGVAPARTWSGAITDIAPSTDPTAGPRRRGTATGRRRPPHVPDRRRAMAVAGLSPPPCPARIWRGQTV